MATASAVKDIPQSHVLGIDRIRFSCTDLTMQLTLLFVVGLQTPFGVNVVDWLGISCSFFLFSPLATA